jgi:putative DNA primase/helicase
MGTIKAVRKYENPITFPETHKLWIDANHLPVISGSENAIWNRLHAIPFTVTIAPEEMDWQLPAKLLTEAEGILAWCVAGAHRWYAEGLGKPAAISDAVDGWREDMNTLGPFLEEMCELRPHDSNAWVKVSEMWKAYSDWADRNDEKRPLTQQALSAQLQSRGVTQGKRDDGRTRVWRGIRFINRAGHA